MTILGVDVGTTGMKVGVFRMDDAFTMIGNFSKTYHIHTYNEGLFSDINPEKWQEAFVAGCHRLHDLMDDVDVISLSGTTPGMTAMDRNGYALYPAILMLDQRSRQQAQRIISTIGMNELLDVTGNLLRHRKPVNNCWDRRQ